MSRLLTAQADDAHAAATRDRAGTADMVLDQACKRAINHHRAGRRGEAAYVLARAGMRAERILGPAPVETVDPPGPIVHTIAAHAAFCDRCVGTATHWVGLDRLCQTHAVEEVQSR